MRDSGRRAGKDRACCAGPQVEGAGFLYRQVRHMVGALVAVGQGRITPEHVAKHLEMGASQLPGAGGAYRGWNCAPAKVRRSHLCGVPVRLRCTST